MRSQDLSPDTFRTGLRFWKGTQKEKEGLHYKYFRKHTTMTFGCLVYDILSDQSQKFGPLWVKKSNHQICPSKWPLTFAIIFLGVVAFQKYKTLGVKRNDFKKKCLFLDQFVDRKFWLLKFRSSLLLYFKITIFGGNVPRLVWHFSFKMSYQNPLYHFKWLSYELKHQKKSGPCILLKKQFLEENLISQAYF